MGSTCDVRVPSVSLSLSLSLSVSVCLSLSLSLSRSLGLFLTAARRFCLKILKMFLFLLLFWRHEHMYLLEFWDVRLVMSQPPDFLDNPIRFAVTPPAH
jgi:hypothetical protein